MSRPGFVFDLLQSESDRSRTYVCRNCGAEKDGTAADDEKLHSAMRLHLQEKHGLTDPSAWRISHHERSKAQAAVCFWPPEAV
jgi:hypothetical protein